MRRAAAKPARQGYTNAVKDSPAQSAFRSIQDLIATATGAPLAGEAALRLQEIVKGLAAPASASQAREGFLTREVTILLADLRGFTAVAATHPAGVVLEMLNRYLVRMSEIIIRSRGTIDKFMGDAIMVLFGAPVAYPDDVQQAIACAVHMQVAMDELNEYHRNLGLPEMFMGVGINTGTVMAGLLGSEAYSEYTVIGDEVNLASRIEAFSLRGQVLIGENTYARCADFLDAEQPISVLVKGKPEPVLLREVLGIPSLGLQVPRREIRRSPRVEATIPFSCRKVENKIVAAEVRDGKTRDLSYHGMLAEFDEPLPAMTDIRLELDLSLLGRRATELYAKTLKTFQVDGRQLTAVEFTSTSAETAGDIRRFVQLLMQGGATK